MSEEKRDYPEWLDRELFSDLDGSAPETDAAPAPDQGVTAPEEAAPDTGKKKKKPAAEEDAAAEKPVKKKKKPVAEEEKTAPEEKRAKKKKKAAADETAAADAPVKKKKKSAEGKAAPAEATAEEKAEANKKAAKRKKAGRAARRGLIALIVIVALAIILCGGAVVGGYLITNSPTNLPNVYIGEVYVGGMTQEQTVKALEDAKWEEKAGGTLTVTLLPHGRTCAEKRGRGRAGLRLRPQRRLDAEPDHLYRRSAQPQGSQPHRADGGREVYRRQGEQGCRRIRRGHKGRDLHRRPGQIHAGHGQGRRTDHA